MRKKLLYLSLLVICILGALCACGMQSQSAIKEGEDFKQLEVTKHLKNQYATEFSIDEYGKYSMLSVKNGDRYLIVPKGELVPTNLDEDIVVLKQPFDKTYLLSTSVMDMLDKLGALNEVRLTGTKKENWYVDSAIKAMEEKKILFAGKYNKPDYELILSEGCNLALENTMIFHNPEVKEKLEKLGIPVFVERASYESHPLGRLEWIKVYGLLYDRMEEANAFFEEEVKRVQPIMENDKLNQTVAVFYLTSNGAVNVRKPNDYIAQMISLAGGKYVLDDVLDVEENALSTMNMQVEDFYAAAKDADILVYNSTIVGELETIDDLVAKSSLFEDFKAVKEKRVYCTSNNFFQQSTSLCDFMVDMNLILLDERENLKYIKELK